jgi:hypothetical protein
LSGQHHAAGCYTPGKDPEYILNKKLCGPLG